MANFTLTASVPFNAANRTLDFSAVPNFDVRFLRKVTHEKTNAPIYLKDGPGRGFSAQAGSVLTLAYDTTALNSSDTLTIIYDNGLPGANAIKYFTEALGASVAAGGSVGGLISRDAGVSPSPWQRFGAVVTSNQAGTLQLIGSDDGSAVFVIQSAAVAVNTPLELSVAVVFRYMYAKFTNGSTAGVVSLKSYLRTT